MYRTAALVIVIIGLSLAPLVQAHKATERYIPIGLSPGVSSQTLIGEVVEVDAANQRLTVHTNGERIPVTATETTRIYLDRSKIRQTNLEGSFVDVRTGRRVEVKFEDPRRRAVAEWIKIEIGELP